MNRPVLNKPNPSIIPCGTGPSPFHPFSLQVPDLVTANSQKYKFYGAVDEESALDHAQKLADIRSFCIVWKLWESFDDETGETYPCWLEHQTFNRIKYVPVKAGSNSCPWCVGHCTCFGGYVGDRHD